MQTLMTPTLYDLLGVARDADRDEIKAAWRDAADRFEPGSGGSSAQFRLFNEAAEVLLDPERRAEYDAGLASADVARELARKPATEPVVEPMTEPTTESMTEPMSESMTEPMSGPAVETAPAPASSAPAVHDPAADEPTDVRRGVPVAVIAVLAVLAVMAVGLAGYLGVQYQRAGAYQDALDSAPASAERAAAAVLAYDYRSLDADRDAAARFLTDGYRDDYVKTFELVQQNAPKLKANVKAEVLASSAMLQSGEEDADRVPVLLFVNQTTVSTANSGEPSVALNRVRFDMVKVDGTWLVDGISSY